MVLRKRRCNETNPTAATARVVTAKIASSGFMEPGSAVA
jgi:hypothetical protein